MSHRATNWAMEQRNMKPATKLVLMCLAKRHNPVHGCFPSHQRIASDAEISERSVRNHLARLEELGLIRRIRGNGGRSERASTRYVFAFEPEFEARTIDISAAKTAKSQRQTLPTNPVKEPLKEEDAREARDLDVLLEGVTQAVGFSPSATLTSWWRGRSAREHVGGWKALGLTDDEIIAVAAETRKQHPAPPDGPKALDRAMERRARGKAGTRSVGRGRGQDGRAGVAQMAKPASAHAKLKGLAEMINGSGYVHEAMFSNGDVMRLLQAGLTTREQILKRGLGILLPDAPRHERSGVAA